MKNIKTFLFLSAGLFLFSCKDNKPQNEPVEETSKQSVTESSFGFLPDSTEIKLFILTNDNGLQMEVMNYGGIITSLKVPDKNGNLDDIVLGYDNLNSYLKKSPYFGAIVGRYGNRIAKGKFSIGDKQYSLAVNNGENHLHGGLEGFDKVVWSSQTITGSNGVGLKLTYTSADMEEGYPGNLKAEVTYFLGNDNTLEFTYKATTDKTTVVNLTQHTYYNLTGAKETILNHRLMLNASEITPVDDGLITTGKLMSVQGTPFNFKEPKEIGKDINTDNEQLKYGKGYDHNFVLDKEGNGMTLAATLYEPESGRYMEIFTTEPGIQFYSGNFLDGSITGKKGVVYNKNMGLALETQHYPDSPNKPEFPSVILNPGEVYKSQTKLKFSVK